MINDLRWWKNDQTPLEFKAATPAVDPAYEEGSKNQIGNVDTSIQSIERAAFGTLGSAMARVNLDDLVGKKGLGIYAKMRVDEQVKAVCVFKRDAILSRGWTFEFDAKSKLSEEERAQRIRVYEKIIYSMPGSFMDALNNISTGREFGYSLTEKVYQPIQVDGKWQVGLSALLTRDPATFEFHVDPYGVLEYVQQLAAGQRIDIDMDKFIHYVHNPEFDVYLGRSDLREAYRSWFFKDQMIKFWGFYMEKLGGGMVIAKVTPDAQGITMGSPTYNALVAVLQSIKATGSVLLPVGVEAEAVFPQNSDAFDKAVGWHDLAIAKALLVPNLLGVSNSGHVGSYAQSQTQLDAFAWTVKADTERLESCVNEQLFKDLGDQNWGDGEYPCFKFKPMDTEKLKWLVETWQKLVTGGTVLASVDDEKRLRDLMDMPPRNPDSELLVSPVLQIQHDQNLEATNVDFQNSEKAKDNQVERGIQEDKTRATDPILSAQEAAKAKEKKFGYKPEGETTPITDYGFKVNSGVLDSYDVTENDWEDGEPQNLLVSSLVATQKNINADNLKNVDTSKPIVVLKNSSANYILDGHHRAVVAKKAGDTRIDAKVLQGSDFRKKNMAAPARDARISIASARERVDFKVIEHKQTLYAEQLSSEWSKIVAQGVKRLLGDDENLSKLIDKDTADIAFVEFSGATKGRLKRAGAMGLKESWATGRQTAENEIRKTGKKRMSRDMHYFTNLRKNAEDYFENNSFRMANNVSDGVRATIQQELQNAVKYGKSPPQTRESIWDRLTNKGFTSRSDVKDVETDAGVVQGLDALWVDDEEQAKHYLDTLARTNLFESMNEARFGEFQDPALEGFVVALRYSAILDDRTTEICQELDDCVWHTDSDNWDKLRPPNHYNCRSLLVPITEVDVQDGLWNGEESDVPSVEPQEGFK